GRGVIYGLPVWFGPFKLTGCPVENVVIAVKLQPPIARFSQPPALFPRPNGSSQTALATSPCLTSKLVGPLEQRRQIVSGLELALPACQVSDSALPKVYSNLRFRPRSIRCSYFEMKA